MPAVTLALIGLGVSAISSIASSSKQKKAQDKQDKAQQAQWETELATHEYNIDLAKLQLTGDVSDIREGGATTQRKRLAAMGASGATLGTGTPLMNMIRSAAGIERDITDVTRAAELEIEFAESEIEGLEDLIDPPETASSSGDPKIGDTKLINGRQNIWTGSSWVER